MANKVIVTITDSAANMMKAFSLYQLPSDDGKKEFDYCDSNEEEVDISVDNDAAYYSDLHERITCFAHTLQLVIKYGLQQAPSVKRVMSTNSAMLRNQCTVHTILSPYKKYV